MKKLFLFLSSFLALAAVAAIGLSAYVYTRDFGVAYKGRARLDYNWKYFFCKKPANPYRYSGQLFSFEYLSYEQQNPVRDSVNSTGGMVLLDDHYLEITWRKDVPAAIKAEIAAYLSGDAAARPSPTTQLSQWLLLESDQDLTNFKDIYTISAKKAPLAGGNTGILFNYTSKTEQRPSKRFFVAVSPQGEVVKAANTIRLNVSEASYRELMFSPAKFSKLYPDPKRDAASLLIFERFLASFAFKKQG